MSRSHEVLEVLFQNAVSIHELTIRLKSEVSKFREVSMNAAIASGHCSGQSRVFAEIAKQINAVSALQNETIHCIQSHISFVTNHMLKCIVKSDQLKKMSEAGEKIHERHNLELVYGVRDELNREIEVLLSQVLARLAYLCPEQETLKVLINRVWSVVLSLRVIANAGKEDEEPFCLSIAEALTEMNDEMLQIVERITRTLELMKERLTSQYESLQGVEVDTQSFV